MTETLLIFSYSFINCLLHSSYCAKETQNIAFFTHAILECLVSCGENIYYSVTLETKSAKFVALQTLNPTPLNLYITFNFLHYEETSPLSTLRMYWIVFHASPLYYPII